MLDLIAQIGITLTGSVGIILIAKKNRWGFVFGLIGEPFWFVTSFLNKQWGIFFITLLYTVSWGFGIYEWFFKKER